MLEIRKKTIKSGQNFFIKPTVFLAVMTITLRLETQQPNPLFYRAEAALSHLL
jgi:hypothetical protein